MRIAAIIVGIENWEKYTLPLVQSIMDHEPQCGMVVIDNASTEPYPLLDGGIHRTERLCYSAAINQGKAIVGDADWYIVLSNDVLCTGPFAHMLEGYGDENVVGPLMKEISIEGVGQVFYIEGWAVFIPKRIWDTIGGWDEGMKISSYEDVEYSHRVRKNGFGLIENPNLPFVHLDQQQRFTLVPDYWSSEYHNRARFIEKYGQRATA